MKRLAWWAIGIGLGGALLNSVFVALAWSSADSVTDRYSSGWYVAATLTNAFDGTVLLVGGVLLAATVIGDAITKAQGTREGP